MTPGERIAKLEAWIENIGDPMNSDMRAIKQTLALVMGGAGVVGVLAGLLAPLVIPIIQAWLKKQGLM